MPWLSKCNLFTYSPGDVAVRPAYSKMVSSKIDIALFSILILCLGIQHIRCPKTTVASIEKRKFVEKLNC